MVLYAANEEIKCVWGCHYVCVKMDATLYTIISNIKLLVNYFNIGNFH